MLKQASQDKHSIAVHEPTHSEADTMGTESVVNMHINSMREEAQLEC